MFDIPAWFEFIIYCVWESHISFQHTNSPKGGETSKETNVSNRNNPQGQRSFPLAQRTRSKEDCQLPPIQRRTHMHISLISWMLQICVGSGKLAPLTMKRRRAGHPCARHAAVCVWFARIAPTSLYLSRPHKHLLRRNESRGDKRKCVTNKMNDLIIRGTRCVPWTFGVTFTCVKRGGASIIYGRSALKQTLVRATLDVRRGATSCQCGQNIFMGI